MASFISKGRLDFLSDKQKTELSRHFMKAGTTAMPHQLAVQLGIEYSEALAILTVLEAEGLCEIGLLIYHNCDPETIAGEIPFGQGFPELPWECPLCEESVESYDELSFDFIAYSKQQIEFL
ncbi:MAG: hypothetical protein NHB32_27265 [Fischerella sp. CENA71]|nr:hypothetical protein [Fischerella sp. CENA71]